MDEDTLETSKIQYSSKREHTLNNSIPNKAIRFYSNNNDNNFDTLESYANLLNLEISPETRRGYRSFERQYRLSTCLLYTSPSPRDLDLSRMPSSA